MPGREDLAELMKPNLLGISETLLIPLWARAVETVRQDAIIRDAQAVELLRKINYDFRKFDKTWMSQLGVAVRTELLDRAVTEFIQKHPEAVVINLGAGLDTRFWRLDNERMRWFDLDLPEVIELRKRYFQESERCRFIGKSILDRSWVSDLHGSGEAVLLIAEGLLMYLEESEVRSLFDYIAASYPKGEMLLEMLGPWLVGKGQFHDTISKISGVEFKWSLLNSQDLEGWNPRIKFIEEWYYTDYHQERWGWFGTATRLSFLKKRLANRIVHIRLNP